MADVLKRLRPVIAAHRSAKARRELAALPFTLEAEVALPTSGTAARSAAAGGALAVTITLPGAQINCTWPGTISGTTAGVIASGPYAELAFILDEAIASGGSTSFTITDTHVTIGSVRQRRPHLRLSLLKPVALAHSNRLAHQGLDQPHPGELLARMLAAPPGTTPKPDDIATLAEARRTFARAQRALQILGVPPERVEELLRRTWGKV